MVAGVRPKFRAEPYRETCGVSLFGKIILVVLVTVANMKAVIRNITETLNPKPY